MFTSHLHIHPGSWVRALLVAKMTVGSGPCRSGTPERQRLERWLRLPPPPQQVTTCWASGWRAELTRARRGQSGAHNGTFPPGVSCQAVRAHGAVAKGAAALWSGREKQAFKNFSPPSKSHFQRALKLNEFQSKSSQDRGLRGALAITHPRRGMNK